MPRMTLDLNNLSEFDAGKAAVLFQQLLRQAVRDLVDRPGDKRPRKVVLQVDVAPIVQQDGDVVDAAVEFSGKCVLPSYHTAARPMGVTRQGDLFFSSDAPDNPRQRTIDEVAENEDEG